MANTNFSYATIPTLSPYQQLISSLTAGNLQQGLGQSLNMYQQSGAGLSRALSGSPSFQSNPSVTQGYFNTGIKTPLLKAFDEEIRPRIRDSYAAQNALFSSRRALAEQKALGDLSTNLAGQLSGLIYNDQQLAAQLAEGAANRQLSAAGLAGQQRQSELATALGFVDQSHFAVQPMVGGGGQSGGNVQQPGGPFGQLFGNLFAGGVFGGGDRQPLGSGVNNTPRPTPSWSPPVGGLFPNPPPYDDQGQTLGDFNPMDYLA